MSAISSQEAVLHVTAVGAEPLNLRVDPGVPAAVRIEVQGSCACQGAGRRPGSYTDTDFGGR